MLLTFHLEALKQLRIIERTPEPDNYDLLRGLTLDEKREVEEFAWKMKVIHLGNVIDDVYNLLIIVQRKRDTGVSVKHEEKHSDSSATTRKRLRSSALSNIVDLTEDGE